LIAVQVELAAVGLTEHGGHRMLEASSSGESQDVMTTRPFIYVCVVSEFNLPEYEACLTLRPQHLVLVVSNFYKLRKASERLVNALHESLPAFAASFGSTIFRRINGHDGRI
jgi:hypothetical protein